MSENTNDTTRTSEPSSTGRALRRSRSNRKIAGVCGGAGEFLGIDPVILRVLVVVLTLFGGSGLIIYAAAWLLVPEEGSQHSAGDRFIERNGKTVAIVVVAVVLLLLIEPWGRRWGGPGPWPLLVIGGVAAAIWWANRQRTNTSPAFSAGSPGPSGPAGPAGPSMAPVTFPSSTSAPSETMGITQPLGPPGLPPIVPVPAPPAPPSPPPAPRVRSSLGLLTWSVAALVGGVLLALDVSGRVHVRPVVTAASVLAVIGAGLLVGSFYGRSRGLIVAGVLLSIVVAIASVVPDVRSSGTGDKVWNPSKASEVQSSYSWGAGNVTVDLGSVAFTGSTDVQVDLGVGQLSVIVPDDVTVVVNASTGIGAVDLPDSDQTGGIGRAVHTTLTPAASPANGTLVLTLKVGIGHLEVHRAQA